MSHKWVCKIGLKFLFIAIFLSISPNSLLSEDNKQDGDCIDKAVKRTMEIRSLPDKKYLYTLDGQNVLLNEFYTKCLCFFPMCNLFEKFYYWQNEIREVASNTENGKIKHKIRCYHMGFINYTTCGQEKIFVRQLSGGRVG